jgi:hypothetical protein
MDPQAAYRKTQKGEQEVATRACRLSARMRSVLIMVDGRILGAELLRRAAALGEGGALLGALIEDGFIETAQPAAQQATQAPAFGAAHQDLVRYASRFLLESLGPASDAMGVRIEACRDAGELAVMLDECREMIRVGAGRRKAEEFWAGVTARSA